MAAETKFHPIQGLNIPVDATTSFTVRMADWGGGIGLTSNFEIFHGKDEPLYFSVTTEKTREVARELVVHNIRWVCWANEIRISLKDRKIDLLYNRHAYKWQGWGELYQLFSEVLGLPKGEIIKIEEGMIGRNAVRISFEEGVDLEKKMQEALKVLQNAFHNGIKDLLRQTESPWKEFAETLPD